jgi:hypothetical protein
MITRPGADFRIDSLIFMVVLEFKPAPFEGRKGCGTHGEFCPPIFIV